MSQPASTPPPPYYAAIFTSLRAAADDVDAYEQTAERMLQLAPQQPGFLGVESVRDANGLGITVSYWSDLEALASWRAHAEHRLAQQLGRTAFYRHYELRIARVERALTWNAESAQP